MKRSLHAISREILSASFLLLLGALTVPARGEDLGVTFDDKGLQSLRHHGIDFLQSGQFQLINATIEHFDGTTQKLTPEATSVRFDAATHTATVQAPALKATCVYEVLADRLQLTIDVANTSDAILHGICLQMLELKFPQQPRGWRPFYPYLAHNLGWPTVTLADFGKETIAVCNEDLGRPLIVGFPGQLSLHSRAVWASSANIGWLSPFLDPLINRPIYPGGTDRYRLSVRFAAGSVAEPEIAGDLLKKFAATYPPLLSWSDRRPIGALFLCRHESVSPINPRAWFDDPKIDFTGPNASAKFREMLLHYADESVRVLKKMNAQGMILWDPEGEEFPHSTTYLGDPRSLPPEMEAAINGFFKKFTAAGLRVGLCVRPQRPMRPAYGGEAAQIDLADPEKNLNEKVTYAQQRWGCTLFYVDSNGDPNVPIDALIFKRVAAAHPEVLLMPEHKNAQYYAYTAPFHSFFHHGITSTPELVRAIYPSAFGVIYAPEGPIHEHRAELLEAVRRGDILIFHGWYDNQHNAEIKQIYEEARRSDKSGASAASSRPP